MLFMNPQSKNGQVFPQTEVIPSDLVIHPSVDPELARGLIAAVEHIYRHPKTWSQTMPLFTPSEDGEVGCVVCHAERLSKWRRPQNVYEQLQPKSKNIGDWRNIFYEVTAFYPHRKVDQLQARVERFLTTGE